MGNTQTERGKKKQATTAARSYFVNQSHQSINMSIQRNLELLQWYRHKVIQHNMP